MSKPAILALEDGNIFKGTSIGADGLVIGEVVFNTSMTGYQEILTDPSYYSQLVTLTYPHIGNTGTNSEDMESERIYAAGLIIRDNSMIDSNWRSGSNLSDFLRKNNTVAIADIDTRRLTRIIREKGALSGCIMTDQISIDKATDHAKSFKGIAGMDLAKVVSTNKAYKWDKGISFDAKQQQRNVNDLPFHVVAYDFGIKRNILRLLTESNCQLTVVPATTSADEVIKLNPDGVFLSNGPGDPEPCDYAISAIKKFLELKVPMFGICLGHQLLAIASGAKTEKMKFGHHGANHPVQDLENGQTLITSQNHGFSVDEKSLPKNVIATHRSLFDGSLQGIAMTDRPAYGFQGHPEASPGPHDLLPLFSRFIDQMRNYRN
ncbi:MAG: carbamoyl-phosphate synthase small subunit [Woeseia sp.]|nr:carbamoyl-phosphate synthase small subunit [Woeseia sp.]